MIRREHASRAWLAAAIAMIAWPASTAPRHQVFSDLCREAESDDVDGHEVTVDFRGGAAPSVSVSWSEGNLEAPVEADEVQFAPKTGRLLFTAMTQAGRFSFDGHVSVAALEGNLRDPWETAPHHVRLRRAPPTGAPLPACPIYPAEGRVRAR